MRSQTARVAVGLLAGLLCISSAGLSASPGSLAGSLIGFVSSQSGVPQMGAGVFLYNHYDRLVGRTLTNERGAFGFESLSPGTYKIRVTLASFVPAVRQNIVIQPGMRSFLSISLASVLSSIELVYSAPGTAKIMSDDWKWVLRTASSTRPVLRFGPQIDITGPADRAEEAKTIFSDTRGLFRVSTGEQGALAAAGTYADLGTAFALATSLFGTNQLELAGSLGYASNAGVPAAGFRTSFSRPDALGGNPVVNVTMRQLFLPARIGTAVLAGGAGDNAPVLRTLSVSSLDRRQLQDNVTLEYGASLESVAFVHRLNYFSPFGRLTYDAGGLGAIQFAYSSGIPPAELLASSEAPEADLSQDLSVLALFPRVSLRSGTARVQRTENFEIAYRKAVGSRSFSVGAYRESVTNAAVMMAAPGGFYSSADLLPDLSSNSSVFNLGAYRRMGYMASLTQKLGDELTFAVAGGSAGVLQVDDSVPLGGNPDQLRHQMRRGRRGWLAARIAAVSPWTGTRLATSYQWTDYSSLSPTHLYLTQGFQPDLGWNLQIRQPLPAVSLWSARLEASAELRNLLAQGYVPLSTVDGRKLFLVQNPRAVRGGLSFIF